MVIMKVERVRIAQRASWTVITRAYMASIILGTLRMLTLNPPDNLTTWVLPKTLFIEVNWT